MGEERTQIRQGQGWEEIKATRNLKFRIKIPQSAQLYIRSVHCIIWKLIIRSVSCNEAWTHFCKSQGFGCFAHRSPELEDVWFNFFFFFDIFCRYFITHKCHLSTCTQHITSLPTAAFVLTSIPVSILSQSFPPLQFFSLLFFINPQDSNSENTRNTMI